MYHALCGSKFALFSYKLYIETISTPHINAKLVRMLCQLTLLLTKVYIPVCRILPNYILNIYSISNLDRDKFDSVGVCIYVHHDVRKLIIELLELQH